MSSLAVVVWFRRNSMLDWPEASHTSPTSTSSNLAESPFCTAASVWPVPQGGMGGSVTLHFPLESVFVFKAVFPKVTVISLLGAAVPEMGMFFPWGSTIWEPKIRSNRGASAHAALRAMAAARMHEVWRRMV